jgi:hypothetical protein
VVKPRNNCLVETSASGKVNLRRWYNPSMSEHRQVRERPA